jgi:hypothetical protein
MKLFRESEDDKAEDKGPDSAMRNNFQRASRL